MRISNYSSTRDKAGHPECGFTPDPVPFKCSGTRCFASLLHHRKTCKAAVLLQRSCCSSIDPDSPAVALLSPLRRTLGRFHAVRGARCWCHRGRPGVSSIPGHSSGLPHSPPWWPGPAACLTAVRAAPEAPAEPPRSSRCRGYRQRRRVNGASALGGDFPSAL